MRSLGHRVEAWVQGEALRAWAWGSESRIGLLRKWLLERINGECQMAREKAKNEKLHWTFFARKTRKPEKAKVEK